MVIYKPVIDVFDERPADSWRPIVEIKSGLEAIRAPSSSLWGHFPRSYLSECETTDLVSKGNRRYSRTIEPSLKPDLRRPFNDVVSSIWKCSTGPGCSHVCLALETDGLMLGPSRGFQDMYFLMSGMGAMNVRNLS